MSLAWTSMVMRAVMMLRCKMGSSPLTKAARALSLWRTHEDRQNYAHTQWQDQSRNQRRLSPDVMQFSNWQIYIKVGQLKLLQGSKVVVVSLQAGVHVFAPHHLRDGEHHLVDTRAVSTGEDKFSGEGGGSMLPVCVFTCDGCPATTHSSLDFTW